MENELEMQGGGIALSKLTVVELRERAKKYKVKGVKTDEFPKGKPWYKMVKAELVVAIRQKYADIGRQRGKRKA